MNKFFSILKRYILPLLLVLLLIVGTAGWFIGSYFVDFAFKRGNPTDPKALPKASLGIISMNLAAPPKPDFKNEVWKISRNGEQRVATAFYAAQPTSSWIIMVHGYCRDQRYVWYYAAEYLNRGYNVLTPDLNASGNSDGQYLTMGIKESEDVVSWAESIVQKDKNVRIALHGVSMGAATVMLAAEKKLPPNVYAVVEDCGYTSAYEMASFQLRKMFDLPAFPVLNMVDIVQKIKLGCYLSEAAPVKDISRVKLPVLFIHGSKDSLIPYTMAEELYAKCGSSQKDIFIMKNAEHARSMYTDREAYFRKVFGFLENSQKQ